MKYFNQRNRSILRELVSTDFKVRYQGSLLGYAWSLLRPLFLFTVLYVIFVWIIPLGKGVENYPVYLLTGVMLWNFFSEATTMGILSVVSRGDLIRKINIPKYLLVIASALSALINFAFGLLVIIIFALIGGIEPSLWWLLIIPLVAELFALAVGIAFLLSSIYVKFRDVSYIWEVFIQIGFYASAIIFPLSAVAEGLRKWFFLNPVTQIIQDIRYVVATNTSVTMWNTTESLARWIVPFLIVITFIVVGGIVFKMRSKSFAEDV
jgi:ABC-2 type transport system permease protein